METQQRLRLRIQSSGPYLSLSLSLSEDFVSLSLLGSYGIFTQPAMLEVKTRIKNNSSSSSLRGRQLTSQRNKLTPSLRSTNNWGFLHHFLLQKHRGKKKEEDKTQISSTQKQKLNYWKLLSRAPLPPPPPPPPPPAAAAAAPSSSSSSYPVCWKTLKTRGQKRNLQTMGEGNLKSAESATTTRQKRREEKKDTGKKESAKNGTNLAHIHKKKKFHRKKKKKKKEHGTFPQDLFIYLCIFMRKNENNLL